MKVITLTQPWATLVALGAKKIETRSWSTSYRGPLAIHAAKGLTPIGGASGLADLCATEPFLSALDPLRDAGEFWAPVSLPRGCIVAVCELVDCVPTRPDWAGSLPVPWLEAARGATFWRVPPDEPELSFGDYSPGRYAWLLANIRPLRQPVPVAGKLSLWEYAGELPL